MTTTLKKSKLGKFKNVFLPNLIYKLNILLRITYTF